MTPADWLYIVIGLAFFTGWIAAWLTISTIDGLTHVSDGPDPLAHDRTNWSDYSVGDGTPVAAIDTPEGRARARRRLGLG